MKTDLQVRKMFVRLTYSSSNSVRQGDLYTYTVKKVVLCSVFPQMYSIQCDKKAKQIYCRVQDGSYFLIISLNFPMCVIGLAQRLLKKLFL